MGKMFKIHFLLVAVMAILLMVQFARSENADGSSKKGGKKLQIGVKKRVDDCKMRSKKGDSLQMHYTVKTESIFLNKLCLFWANFNHF